MLGNLANRVYKGTTPRVMGIVLFGMLLSLTVDVLIAVKLGTGESADALIIALSVPLYVDAVIRSGTKFSLVPLFLERRGELGHDDYNRFISGVTNLFFIVALAAMAVAEISAHWLVSGLAPGLSATAKAEAATLLRLSVPLVIFVIGVSVLSVVLNNSNRFTIAAARSVVVPATVIVSMYLAWEGMDISLWIAVGYVVGFALFYLLLFRSAVGLTGYRHTWTVIAGKRELRSLFGATYLPTAGFIIRQSSQFVERMLASTAAVGGVASYYYAFRLFSAAQNLIGSSIATTTLPAMVEHNMNGEKLKIALAIRRGLLRSLTLSVPVAVALLFFNTEIVDILYGRGSFGVASVEQTSRILMWFGLGIVFICFVPILSSGLYAQKAYGFVFVYMLSLTAVNVLLALLFFRVWSLEGLSAAVSLSAAIGVAVLVCLLSTTGVVLLKR